MSSSVHFGVRVCVLTGFAAVACFASTARAEVVVAEWKFNGTTDADFCYDSSGHGHTLTNAANSVARDTTYKAEGEGSALFSGGNVLTGSNIDLTPYTSIEVSWYQRYAADAAKDSAVFMQTAG